MGISSGVGLVSGIDHQALIEKLMELESRPKTLLQSRISQTNQQKLALTDLSTRLTSLKLSFTTLKKISTFQKTQAASSNQDALTATTGSGASPGTYRFQVARLVTSQQSVSKGFASTTTKVGTGTVSVAPGDGPLVSSAALTQLNGGAGVPAGKFTITNRAGTVKEIDLTSAGTLDDVVTRINAADISVRAEITGDGLKLTDSSGGEGNLIVQNVGASTSATSLGILTAPEGVASNTLAGTDIHYLANATAVSSLNDGIGIRMAQGNDLRITFADASTVDIDLGTATTVGQILDTINAAGAGKVTASINPATDGITLTSSAGSMTVTALNGSGAAADLGLLQSGSTIQGKRLLSGLNTVLISSLNGGTGLTLGEMTITNRSGASATIDLNGAVTVQDMIDKINAAGISVAASLTNDKTGIQLTDTTGGEGDLVVANANGSTIATQLGLAGNYDTGYTSVTGVNLKRARLVAGTITVEMGGGEITSQTLLSQLRGGEGIRRGSFRITDRSGHSAVIDINGAFTLDDVLKRINTSLDIAVKAQVSGDKITLSDVSGQTTSNLIVTDLGGGSAAADLGIAGSTATNAISGQTINYLGRSTSIASLNDDLGIRTASGNPDFRITARDGTTFDISVNGLTTAGAVLDAINNAAGGKVVASIPANGKGIRLTDTTGGAGNLSVSALNNSKAAADLGIEQNIAGSQLDGTPLIASINTVRLASLRGGAGLNLGSISVTDRTGASSTIDLRGALTVQDILDRISDASGVSVTARLKSSGNGIEIVDDSGGSGNLIIADVDSSTASELGILGTHTPGTSVVLGANLQRKWVNENTRLTQYNGGKGVSLGVFRITNSDGLGTEFDLTKGSYQTLGDIIREINSKSAGVTASINANGDGLLLTDTAGGPGRMKVEDISGRSAADLNIKGAATSTTLDGSFEKTIALSTTDTIATALDAINLPGFGVTATLVNDGSSATPYRISLAARNSGRAGRFTFDAGSTILQTSNLVEAQDAAVLYGGAGGDQSLVITSSTNQISGMVKGLTLDLHSVTSSPVTVTVTESIDSVTEELNKFVENYNGLVAKIGELTAFDSKTNKKGILLGDSTAQRIETQIQKFTNLIVKDAGTYRRLSDIGLKMGKEAKLEFDEEKFRAAYASDPESTRKLFTLYEKGATSATDKKGMGLLIEEQIDNLIDPVNGIITRQSNALTRKTDDMEGRITQLDRLLENKRTRLEKQFASMEAVLANLQSQQQSLSSLSSLSTSRSSSSK